MSTASSTKQASNAGTSLQPLLLAGLVGGVIATVVNTVLFFGGQAANGGPLLITMAGAAEPEALQYIMVVLLSILPGVAAGALYWALGRFTATPTRWFLVLSGIVFVAFFFGPFNVATGFVTIATLELMHVGTAAPVIWSVLRASRV